MQDTLSTLYLIRHGSVVNPFEYTYGRVRNVPLSDVGKTQMEYLGKSIQQKGDSPSSIYVSSLRRTQESAEVLHSLFSEAVIYKKDELMESETKNYIGRPLSWLHTIDNPYDVQNQQQYGYTTETEESQKNRVITIIREALSMYSGHTICIVSHGDPLLFALEGLLHPGRPFRPISVLKKELYLLRGEAWRLVINDTLEVKEQERFTQEIQPDTSYG